MVTGSSGVNGLIKKLKNHLLPIFSPDFHGSFQVYVTWFFAFFSGVPDSIDLFTLYNSVDKVVL